MVLNNSQRSIIKILSEEDSEKGSESDNGQSDSSNSKTQSEKIQVTSGLYDVFR